jgi:5-methylcytosine-specific restriction endonuclease McrA
MRTTILNLDYSIINVVSWQQGMVLLLKGVVIPIEFWEKPIRSGSGELYQVPKVVTVKKYVKHQRKYHPTKKNIFLRDNYTCVYCGHNRPQDMTIDHVLPKSRKGKDTWENLVCACSKCNHAKADRTPEEAGMKLRTVPRNPKEYSWDEYQSQN